MLNRVFSSLRVRLIVLALLPILPALGLAFFNYFVQQRLVITQAQEKADKLTLLIANDQNNLIANTQEVLIVLTELPQIKTIDYSNCSDTLAYLVEQYPRYLNLGVVAPNGNLLCSAVPPPSNLNLADQSWFRRATLSQDYAVGDYAISPITNQRTITLALPHFDAAGTLEFIVFASLDLEKLLQIPGVAELPEGVSLKVFDRNGTIMAIYPAAPELIGQSAIGVSLFQTILTQGKGQADLEGVDGVRRLYAFRPINARPPAVAYVSVGFPKAATLAPIQALLYQNLLALGVTTLAILAIALLFGNWLVLGRLNALLRATRQLTAGNWKIRIALPNQPGEMNQLAHAFDQMAATLEQNEQQLRIAEARYRALVEQIPAVVYTASLDEALGTLYVSPQIQFITGFTPEEWISSNQFWLSRVHPDDCDRVRLDNHISLSHQESFCTEYRLITVHNQTVWIRDEAIVVRDANGKPQCYQGIMFDITERRSMEEALKYAKEELEQRVQERTEALQDSNHRLRKEIVERQAIENQLVASLGEKEVLLKEIHHRVKNNLQIISSLLRMQTQSISDEKTLDALMDCQSRVNAMALIHQKLYQSKDLAKTDFPSYLKDLVKDLTHSYKAPAQQLEVQVSIEEVYFGLDTAIPCGLIVNELVSNALKYAFPEQQAGEIEVKLWVNPQHNGSPRRYGLSVRDTGVGLPTHIDFEKTHCLGLKLVRILTRQLRGTIEVERDRGTCFTIHFMDIK